jgi:hypothetical protein
MVLTRLKENLNMLTIAELWTMFVEAQIAKGIAKIAPIKEPKSDIFIVSISGIHMLFV